MEEMKPPATLTMAKYSYVADRGLPLHEAIEQTQHAQQHVGYAAHRLILQLPVNERTAVVRWLERVVREGLN
jgi:hypothetical protein